MITFTKHDIVKTLQGFVDNSNVSNEGARASKERENC